MSRTVSFGLVGWSRTSGQLVRRLADLPQLQLRWLCDPPSELKLGPLAHRLGARRTYDPNALFGDEHVDAVVVCAPYGQRAELVERSLEAEKHVLVLGPVAASRVETDRLLKLATERQRVLDATTPFLSDPALTALAARLAAGQLGELYYLQVDCSHREEAEESVDLFSELAADDIAALLRLAHDRPVVVNAALEAYTATDSADVLSCTFRFATGVAARLLYSRVEACPRHVLRVVGSHGTATLDRNSFEHRLVIHDRYGLDGSHALAVRLPVGDPYVVVCEEFLTAVRTGSPRTSSAELVAVAEAIEALSEALAHETHSQPARLSRDRPKRDSKGDLRHARAAQV